MADKTVNTDVPDDFMVVVPMDLEENHHWTIEKEITTGFFGFESHGGYFTTTNDTTKGDDPDNAILLTPDW